jgi:hypothetical protein
MRGNVEPVPTVYQPPSGERALRIANLNDIEEEAAKVIPRGAFAYIAAGSATNGPCAKTAAPSIDMRFVPEHCYLRSTVPPIRSIRAVNRFKPASAISTTTTALPGAKSREVV